MNMVESNQGKKIKFELSELTMWKVGTIAFGILLIVSVLTGGFGMGGSVNEVPSVPSNVPAQAPPSRVDVQVGDAFAVGDEDAPVTMVEFSDFLCPFCGRFYEQTLS